MRPLLCALVLLALGPAALAQAPQLVNAFPNVAFSDPVDLQAPDDGSNRLFVVERAGRIRVLVNDPGTTTAPVFLDLTDRVFVSDDGGLIGLAFDPDYVANGYFYVNYTANNPLRTVIARFRVSAGDPDVADPGSETILLQLNQPTGLHKGGRVAFGPPEGPGGERYLYAALGDGGPQGDPQNHAQDLGSLLGKLVRLDVDGGGLPLDCAAGAVATIPPTNPFVGAGGACDEVYAYGFRNPFRFSFGPDDRLWLGDVGDVNWEEVDLVEAGGNYGWHEFEGNHCFAAPCNPSGKTFPIHEYHHMFDSNGGFAVTGGYVYAGANCVGLRDRFVYGDYVTGNVWALDYDGTTATNALLLGLTGKLISTFGEDEQGELYLADLLADAVFRFDCASAVTVSATPVGSTVVPPEGGPIRFDVTLTNTTGQPQTFQAWLDADLSNGHERSPAVGPRTVTLPAGASTTRRIRLNVPAGAPAGTSTLTVKVGGFPDGPTDSDRFTVLKQSGATPEAGADAVWAAEGWPGAAGAAPTAAPALQAAPNPFSAGTTLRFALAEAADVRLAVYDVLGREVAVLLDGRAEAGAHAVRFDAGAAGLPAGVYVARLRAGDGEAVQRVTLLR